MSFNLNLKYHFQKFKLAKDDTDNFDRLVNDNGLILLAHVMKNCRIVLQIRSQKSHTAHTGINTVTVCFTSSLIGLETEQCAGRRLLGDVASCWRRVDEQLCISCYVFWDELVTRNLRLARSLYRLARINLMCTSGLMYAFLSARYRVT